MIFLWFHQPVWHWPPISIWLQPLGTDFISNLWERVIKSNRTTSKAIFHSVSHSPHARTRDSQQVSFSRLEIIKNNSTAQRRRTRGKTGGGHEIQKHLSPSKIWRTMPYSRDPANVVKVCDLRLLKVRHSDGCFRTPRPSKTHRLHLSAHKKPVLWVEMSSKWLQCHLMEKAE